MVDSIQRRYAENEAGYIPIQQIEVQPFVHEQQQQNTPSCMTRICDVMKRYVTSLYDTLYQYNLCIPHTMTDRQIAYNHSLPAQLLRAVYNGFVMGTPSEAEAVPEWVEEIRMRRITETTRQPERSRYFIAHEATIHYQNNILKKRITYSVKRQNEEGVDIQALDRDSQEKMKQLESQVGRFEGGMEVYLTFQHIHTTEIQTIDNGQEITTYRFQPRREGNPETELVLPSDVLVRTVENNEKFVKAFWKLGMWKVSPQ